MLSEIGGIALKIDDHFYFPKVYGHHTCKTRKALARKYQHLYEKDIIPLKKKGCLVGAIYTQLSDCETEANGLFTFDRKVLKIDARLLRKINAELTELSLDSEESK
jgi:choline kinase